MQLYYCVYFSPYLIIKKKQVHNNFVCLKQIQVQMRIFKGSEWALRLAMNWLMCSLIYYFNLTIILRWDSSPVLSLILFYVTSLQFPILCGYLSIYEIINERPNKMTFLLIIIHEWFISSIIQFRDQECNCKLHGFDKDTLLTINNSGGSERFILWPKPNESPSTIQFL